MIGWILLLAITAFFCYYGYHLLVKRGGVADAGAISAQCHLCRNSFPVSEMVAREKDAGFVNYFCGECVSKLFEDYSSMRMNR